MSGLEITSLKPLIGSEVRATVDALASGAFSNELRALLLERGVLVFRDLDITLDQQRDITASLGRIRPGVRGNDLHKISADQDEAPELAGYVETTFFWHTDGNPGQTTPCLGGSFRPIRLPANGGETEFLNAYAAYERLDEETRRLIDGLRAVHSKLNSGLTSCPQATAEQLVQWRSTASATQPLVWEHVDGRKSLMLGASISHIEGLHPADSYDLLCRLRAHIMQDEFVYTHQWRANDLLVWNNTGTFHRARPYAAASGRLLHRFTLDGEEPIRAPGMAAKGG